jgi:hypothetical protein
MTSRRSIEQKICEHFVSRMDKEVAGLRKSALHDLHFGPMSVDIDGDPPYPGYTKALEKLRSWSVDTICPVWVDVAGELHEGEPRDEDDESVEQLWTLREVKIAVFRDLIHHGGM